MHLRLLFIGTACLASALTAADDPAWTESVERAALEFNRQLAAATQELVATRTRIATERLPFEERQRDWQNKIIALEARILRVEAEQSQAGARRSQLQAEVDSLNRNLAYVASLGREGLDALNNGLLPGEAAALGTTGAELRQRIEQPGHLEVVLATLDAAEFFLARLKRQLGGHTTPGTALREGDNLVLQGMFAYLGPDVFFRSETGEVYGTVRESRDFPHPVTHAVKDWPPSEAASLMRGDTATVLADASAGKALRLHESREGLWTELKKGGVVGYVIMGLGVVALLIVGMKVLDLQQLALDSPVVMQAAVGAVARGTRADAEAALPRLRRTTRELLATGLRYMDGPRAQLEEQLEGFVLRQRLQQERRLPLLAVIATAGPLLGLLGTVTGMIKTFTLITVFGTGSAGRLSGGISEALVATALGLAVAIPTLVVHGFLSHRVHKELGLLERYALEFVAAVGEARTGRAPTSPPTT